MTKFEPVTAVTLHAAYTEAVNKAGENPNALGFMRRVPGQPLYREQPKGHHDAGYDASEPEMRKAQAACRLAARVGRW